LAAEETMYTLAADEKATTVMIYSQNMLVRGEVALKQNVRVSIWLRTQGMPNFIHVYKTQALVFGGASPKTLNYEEMFFPTSQAIGFHIAPPAADSMDYDATEAGRRMLDLTLLMGTFSLKARTRISTHADFATSIDVARSVWMSLYDAEIANTFFPSMPVIRVPMLLVRPDQVSFAMGQLVTAILAVRLARPLRELALSLPQ